MKAPMEGAETVCGGRVFQSLTVLGKNELRRWSTRQGILPEVEVWLRRALWGSFFKSGTLTAARPLLVLYSMSSPALLRRCSNEGQSSSCSICLTLAVFWGRFRANLAALRCTASSLSMSFCAAGSHTAHGYSWMGRVLNVISVYTDIQAPALTTIL